MKFGHSPSSKIFKFLQCILTISLLFPLGKGHGPLFEKLQSTSPRDALCQVWLKLAYLFLGSRFSNFVDVFMLVCDYLPLEKGMALHLNNPESPLSKDALCQV